MGQQQCRRRRQLGMQRSAWRLARYSRHPVSCCETESWAGNEASSKAPFKAPKTAGTSQLDSPHTRARAPGTRSGPAGAQTARQQARAMTTKRRAAHNKRLRLQKNRAPPGSSPAAGELRAALKAARGPARGPLLMLHALIMKSRPVSARCCNIAALSLPHLTHRIAGRYPATWALPQWRKCRPPARDGHMELPAPGATWRLLHCCRRR